jgi:hypothetical protein
MKSAASLFLVLVLLASGAAAQTASTQTAGAEPHIDTVNVNGLKITPEKIIHDYVRTYAKPTTLMGKLARWGAGTPLCPKAVGLPPEFNVFVSERIRTVAGMVGARVQTKVPCDPNMVVLFTPHPQLLLDAIASSRTDLLGYHFAAQVEAMSKVTHPIQAWYATATRDDNGVLIVDNAQAFDECVTNHGGGVNGLMACQTATRGTRLLDGAQSEMFTVTVVVDNAKIVGLPLGAVADYISMLALSQTQEFETCQPFASIVNLMTQGCDASLKTSELSQSDIAFLKAVNSANQNFIGEIQVSDVARHMETSLGGH